MPFAEDCLDAARVAVNAIPVVRTQQCACDEVRVDLKDPNTGEACDLTQYGIVPESSSSSSSSSSEECELPCWCDPTESGITGVHVVTKTLPSSALVGLNKFAVVKTVEDAQRGIVYLQLDPTDTESPGLWGAMAIVRQCGVSRKAFPFFFEVMPSLAQINAMSGPLTIYEVRIAVRDSDPNLNFLLDAHDFEEHEVAFMIRKAIDMWNETPPHTVAPFHMNNFPFRHHWIEATVGQLMLMVSDHMRRNDLDYSAAGLSIQDTKKWPYYNEEGRRRVDEFKAWAAATKLTINIEGGFASLGGYRQTVYR